MFEFAPKRNIPEMESMMDDLVMGKTLTYRNGKKARLFGIYAKPLRNKKNSILHLSYDSLSGESIAYLKINNHIRPNIVSKYTKKGKPMYIFRDTLLPKKVSMLLK